MMNKAMITGGGGFIGYHLANKLLEKKCEVFLIDNFSNQKKDLDFAKLCENKNIHFVEQNLLSSRDLNELGKDFTTIFHLAALLGVKNVIQNPFKVLKENVQILFSILQFAQTQKKLERFVFFSTSEVYSHSVLAQRAPIPTAEDVTLCLPDLEEPRSSYLLSKIYGEALVKQSHLPFSIVRPHNIYGPRMGMRHVIPELLQKAYLGKENGQLEVFSPDHTRSFCFIKDAVAQIQLISETPKGKNQVFNIGAEDEISIKKLAEIILQVVGKKMVIFSKPPPAGSPPRRCPDMKKTLSITSYKTKVDLLEGISKTFMWYKKEVFESKLK